MKFISQRNIALLCYSSNMVAANTLYKFQYVKIYCEKVSTKSAGWKLLYSRLLNFTFKILYLLVCLSCRKNSKRMLTA